MIHEQWDDIGKAGVVISNNFFSYKDYGKNYPDSFKQFYFDRYGKVDDFDFMVNKLTKESLITGNAGGRMACAIIGRRKMN